MNRTDAANNSWPWACKHIADVNNTCASPALGWKTPISVRHGCTPDISAFLQCQHWEHICFKVNEQSPCTTEAAGRWLGVSHTVGDLMTFDIWTEKTNKIVQRSAIRPEGTIDGLRVPFDDIEGNQELPGPDGCRT